MYLSSWKTMFRPFLSCLTGSKQREWSRWVLGWEEVTLRHELWDFRPQDTKWLPADCGTYSGKASTQSSRKACRSFVPEWLPGSLVNYWIAYLSRNQVSLPTGCRAWEKNHFKIWLVGGMDVGIFLWKAVIPNIPIFCWALVLIKVV